VPLARFWITAALIPVSDSLLFLDKPVEDLRRLRLATKLGISVVFEEAKGGYRLENPELEHGLAELFVP
jgi:hypothetical protein